VTVRFGAFALDAGTRELLRDGTAVHLSPRAFDVLEILVARRPNVVSKDVLLETVWSGKTVEEANLAIAVGEIRKALGDDPKAPTIVVTVPRRGYRFAAPATETDAAPSTEYPRWWLVWNERTLPLREGENVIGRHPASTVWLNVASVSRVHARITADGQRVSIEDRESRNGTIVNGKRIVAARLLIDGDRITIGAEELTFREWSDDKAGTEPVRKSQKAEVKSQK
jgi:DNA-binding winged helix-turn-helix (wHTH) protein